MNDLVTEAIEYAHGTWQHRWAGLAVAWIVAIAGIVWLWSTPDQYEASARVYVDTQTVLKPLMSGLAVEPNVDAQLAMLSRTLINRPNVEKLIRKTDLDLDRKTPAQRDALVESLMQTLAIKSAGRDNLYTISFRDADPAQAKNVVQYLLSIFVESSMSGKRSDSDQAKQFIEEQIVSYERKLAEAENRLKEFKLKNLRILSGGSDSDYISSMKLLEASLNSAKVELRAAEQRRDALKREVANEEPTLAATQQAEYEDQIATPEIDARLEVLGKQLDELLRGYTDQHPDVVGTRRIIAQLEKEKKEEIARQRAAAEARRKSMPPSSAVSEQNPVYQQLKFALADAEAQVAGLRERMRDANARYAELDAKARSVPEVETQLAQLNRDYEVQRQNYLDLVKRRESANISSEMQDTTRVADFKIIDPPAVSAQPVAPNRLILLGLVFAASIGAGIGIAFLASELWPTFHSTRKLRLTIDRPVLGAISLVEKSAAKRRRRRGTYGFAGALMALLAGYGGAFAVLFLSIRVT